MALHLATNSGVSLGCGGGGGALQVAVGRGEGARVGGATVARGERANWANNHTVEETYARGRKCENAHLQASLF